MQFFSLMCVPAQAFQLRFLHLNVATRLVLTLLMLSPCLAQRLLKVAYPTRRIEQCARLARVLQPLAQRKQLKTAQDVFAKAERKDLVDKHSYANLVNAYAH